MGLNQQTYKDTVIVADTKGLPYNHATTPLQMSTGDNHGEDGDNANNVRGNVKWIAAVRSTGTTYVLQQGDIANAYTGSGTAPLTMPTFATFEY